MWLHIPYMDPMGYDHFGRSIHFGGDLFHQKKPGKTIVLMVFLTCMEQLCLHACFSGAEDMEDV